MNPELLCHRHGRDVIHDAYGGYWESGSLSELVTLSTIGATTDSAANLLPADAIIECVIARVTTTITTATDWAVGDGTEAERFTTALATLTAGTTRRGLNHWAGSVATDALGPTQATAAPIRITCTGTPSAGAVRVTVFYRRFSGQTS